VNSNYGNVQVYKVYATPEGMVRCEWRVVRRKGIRVGEIARRTYTAHVSPTAGSVITGSGGGRCDFLRIFVIRLKCVSFVSRFKIYARVITECTPVLKTI
jgi:hypothetical protein